MKYLFPWNWTFAGVMKLLDSGMTGFKRLFKCVAILFLSFELLCRFVNCLYLWFDSPYETFTMTFFDALREIISLLASGYALKLIKQFNHLWVNHYKGKLISKIITNLVIYQASTIGRAPTKSDVVKVVEILEITENNLGVFDALQLEKGFFSETFLCENKNLYIFMTIALLM